MYSQNYLLLLTLILSVKWWQYIQNEFIVEKSKLPGMYDKLAQQNLRWAGHLNTQGQQTAKTDPVLST